MVGYYGDLGAMPDMSCQAEGQQQALQLWCGLGQGEEATLMGINANAVLKRVSLPSFLFFDQLRF
jgi:hypothetical protein